VQDLVPAVTRDELERTLTFQGRPVAFRGTQKNGFAELFTLAEINQNIFVFAARQAGMAIFDQGPLPARTPEEAARILVGLARAHDFTFYKYQIPDLVSHTGRVAEARAVFATIERFVAAILTELDPSEATVMITSDHGHLEQLATSRGHPKSKVPTWYFGPQSELVVPQLRRPEGIFQVLRAGAEEKEFARERI
jgi:hypothetical protein